MADSCSPAHALEDTLPRPGSATILITKVSGQLSQGVLFAQRYRVIDKLAVGGMGTVYRVEDLSTARHRALKVMHEHISLSSKSRARFQQEARIDARVKSDHIVDVIDAGIDDEGVPFMVMELLDGEDLRKRLKRLGPLPDDEVVGYVKQTAMALDAAHAADVVHRDLKPDNLFRTLRDDGTACIKLLDFGIAKLVEDTRTLAQRTRSVGTPAYMAPEQFRSGSFVSAVTDVYALGLVTFTLLVGKHFWSAEASKVDNVFEFAALVKAGPVRTASECTAAWVKLPATFDAWFSKATALSPANRFDSAGAASEALHKALSGVFTETTPTRVDPPAGAATRRDGGSVPDTVVIEPRADPSSPEADAGAAAGTPSEQTASTDRAVADGDPQAGPTDVSGATLVTKQSPVHRPDSQQLPNTSGPPPAVTPSSGPPRYGLWVAAIGVPLLMAAGIWQALSSPTNLEHSESDAAPNEKAAKPSDSSQTMTSEIGYNPFVDPGDIRKRLVSKLGKSGQLTRVAFHPPDGSGHGWIKVKAQSPDNPSYLDAYVFRGQSLEGPESVSVLSLGNDTKEDAINRKRFPLARVDFDLFRKLTKDCSDKVAIKGSKISHVILDRFSHFESPVTYQIFIESRAVKGNCKYDLDGKLLGKTRR